MRVSVALEDAVLEDLRALTDETDPARAVEAAVKSFIRTAKLERLRQQKGKIPVLSNDEIEAGELEELTA